MLPLLDTVIIKGSSEDATLVVTVLAGLGGVSLGAALTAIIDLWKRALEGQAACRVIRLEILGNATKIDGLQRSWFGVPALAQDAWLSNQLVLAPHLGDQDFVQLSRLYASSNGFEALRVDDPQLERRPPNGNQLLSDWIGLAKIIEKNLKDFERRNTFAVGFSLLRHRRPMERDEIQFILETAEQTTRDLTASTPK